MNIAASFKDALLVAEQHCQEWLFTGSGKSFKLRELEEIAGEYDAKTPLGELDFLVITDDGSIGLMYAFCEEPLWYFVSPEFAVANILKEDPRKYMVPADDSAQMAGRTGAAMGNVAGAVAFCKQCGAPLRSGSRFCENCGAKNAPEFCTNCGAKLNPNSNFCKNCGTRV